MVSTGPIPKATKNPARGVRGFSGSGGQYWTRTSDLYHVKVAL